MISSVHERSVLGIGHRAAVDRVIVDHDDAFNCSAVALHQEQCTNFGKRGM